MKYLLAIFFLSFCFLGVSGQEKHFVFIQSDNNQPFYVSLNGKLYSSTAIGYIIVPKLTNGDYNFSLGFAKNAFPEQSFKCTIDNKDLGFNLKNFGEKGWGLFNLQTLDVTMAESGGSDVISKALSAKDAVKDDTDPVISFKRTKKEVANPPSVTTTPTTIDTTANVAIAKNDEKENEVKSPAKEDEVNANEVKDDLKEDAEKGVDINGGVKAENVPVDKGNENDVKDGNAGNIDRNQNNSERTNSDIKKVSESRVEDGLHLAYTEGDSKRGDTINIIIPADNSLQGAENNSTEGGTNIESKNDTASGNSAAEENAVAKKDDLKFLDINSDNTKKDVSVTSDEKPNKVTVISNSKCKDIANDDDYTRLRRKMAGETTDEKMINVARKVYKNKCFTTSQIKNLSTLFLSDEGRFNFFKASYNSVSDVAEYSSLQSEFIDPAFADRFKSMVK